MSNYQSPKIGVNTNVIRGIALGIFVLIIIGVVATASVKIVDSGHRGVLLHWNAVDLTNPPLDEGLHFVTPFQDDVVNIEVRTLKYASEARSASQDLQTVETTVTV
nr:prohibitin family protein [archaeon]